MKKIILILMICFTIGCTSSTQTVKMAGYETGEPPQAEINEPGCGIESLGNAALIGLEVWWWLRIFN